MPKTAWQTRSGLALAALVLGLTAPGVAGVPNFDEFTGVMKDLAKKTAANTPPLAGPSDRMNVSETDQAVAQAVATEFERRLAILKNAEAALDHVAAMPTDSAESLHVALEAALALQEQVAAAMLAVVADMELSVDAPEMKLKLLSALEERTEALEASAEALARTLEKRAASESCDKG